MGRPGYVPLAGKVQEDVYKTRGFVYKPDRFWVDESVWAAPPGAGAFEEGIKHALRKGDRTLEGFHGTLPNNRYKTEDRPETLGGP